MASCRYLILTFNKIHTMKKIIYTSILTFLVIIPFNAQLLSNFPITSSITNSNVFLDASSNFSTEAGAGANVGKGIVVPSVDLVNFEFDLTMAEGSTFPTFFDGMVVYNKATGSTLITGNRSSTATAVTPGFYYFSNPNGYNNQNVTGGTWKPLGGSQTNIGTSETATTTAIANNTIYAIKGQFTVTAGSTAVTLAHPTGMTSLYRITIYKDSNVYATSVYSYNKSTGATITGSPSIATVYPVGVYDYTLEYLK
jgi:hypothetical protein